LLILTLSTLLSAQFSGRQPNTVSLDIGISVLRLLLPVFVILTSQELLTYEFDRRYFLNSFSYPHARHSLLLGRFATVTILTIGLLILLSTSLALIIWIVGNSYPQATPVALGIPYVITIAFIGADLVLLSAVATLLAVIASTPSFVLVGTLGFMIVARSFGAIIELLTHNAAVVGNVETYRSSIGLISYLVPDLGALDVRKITLYGRMEFLPSDWPWLLLSCLAYTTCVLALAVMALQRKRFA